MVSYKYYTKDILKEYLIKYYETYKRVPTMKALNKTGYPSSSTYQKYFGSWNNALKAAGLPINKTDIRLNKPNICEICGTIKTDRWHNKNGLRICSKCYKTNRNYLHGTLNPKSNVGMGLISEYVVYNVLNDCNTYNTQYDFNSQYDLISNKYGNVNVKSSALHKKQNWHFGKHLSGAIPDNYICIGFNENKTEILKGWVIPGNSTIMAKFGIHISINKLQRVLQYEVDVTPYNDVYQNLDIYSLPEFNNFKEFEDELPEDTSCDGHELNKAYLAT